MTRNTLKLAFIGGAVNSAVGYAHFNACRLDGHFEVVAGCFSRDVDQRLNTSRVYGVHPERNYSDWQALLECEKGSIDAVAILTPTPSHAELATASIESGYPVICEKALGTSTAECYRILEAVNASSGYLAVTFNYSGYPMVRELKRMIGNGRIGRLQQIQIEMPQEGYLRANANPQNWRRRDYDVPAVSLDLGTHVHHLIDFLTGGLKPVSLVAEQAGYGQVPGIIDNVYCIAHYQQDVRVQAWWGKTALGYRNGLRVRVYGERASAEWYQMDPEILRYADEAGHIYLLDRGSPDAEIVDEPRYNRFKSGHPSGFIEAFANLYTDIATDLRGFIGNNRTINPYVYGAEQALEGLKMMAAIDRSAKIKRWVI